MTATAKSTARKAESSDAAEWGARAGIAARGLLWLVIGFIAVRLSFGEGGKADKRGAFSTIRDQPLGKALLVALALGFAAHAVFRILEGTVGRREERDDRKRLLKRLWSLVRAVVYGALAVSVIRFLVSGGGSSDNAKKPTADVMSHSGGRWLVGLIGAGVVIGGIAQVVRGLRRDFTEKLNMPGGTMSTVVKRAGTIGLAGRGVVYALVGSFLVEAALKYEPSKAKGLDESLKTLAGQPYGAVLLFLTAAGMLGFAIWSFLEARYRDL
ncbi:MAG: putative integral rane protein [Frankiales bacterium]|nr:putative integral rane protein [Frankiales bacterium]